MSATMFGIKNCDTVAKARKWLEAEQIAYDFEELEPMQRLHIDELFWSNGIPHAWDDTSLVVRAEDEEESDRLIDDADRDAFLTSDAEQISYELADWDDVRREELVGLLEQAGIEHAWDEHGELVVLEDDEDRVDAILDTVEFGMTFDEAQRAAGTRLAVVEGTAGSSCYRVDPEEGPEGVTFLVSNGTVERVDIDSGAVKTRSGAGIGTSISELTGLYQAASFFGLGISLVLVSLLYQRFVFRGGLPRGESSPEPPAPGA